MMKLEEKFKIEVQNYHNKFLIISEGFESKNYYFISVRSELQDY